MGPELWSCREVFRAVHVASLRRVGVHTLTRRCSRERLQRGPAQPEQHTPDTPHPKAKTVRLHVPNLPKEDRVMSPDTPHPEAKTVELQHDPIIRLGAIDFYILKNWDGCTLPNFPRRCHGWLEADDTSIISAHTPSSPGGANDGGERWTICTGPGPR